MGSRRLRWKTLPSGWFNGHWTNRGGGSKGSYAGRTDSVKTLEAFMQLAVTIQQKDLDELRNGIIALRQGLTAANVTVLEAPEDMNYPYPTPILTIREDETKRRLFGTEAVEKLRDLAQQR